MKVAVPLIQLFASLVALVLSYTALKQQFFTHFEPAVTVAIPGFAEIGDPRNATLALVLPVTLLNSGEHAGCFEDFMARVSYQDSSQRHAWWFAAQQELRQDIISAQVSPKKFRDFFEVSIDVRQGATESSPTPIGAKYQASTFTPAKLSGRSSREKLYLLVPYVLPNSSNDRVMRIRSLPPKKIELVIDLFISESERCSPSAGFSKIPDASFAVTWDVDDTTSLKEGDLLFLTDKHALDSERSLMKADPH